jgi:transketolase
MEISLTTTDLDALSVNTIRGLCMDAIQQANSGHPGTPLGIAPVAYTLWQRFLRFDPADPIWPNRDRFVLSEGHTYRDEVLPPAVKARVAVEQASTLGWDRYVGDGGAVIGMHTFGASAPLKELLTKFGFTTQRVSQVARERVAAATAAAGATRAEGKDST